MLSLKKKKKKTTSQNTFVTSLELVGGISLVVACLSHFTETARNVTTCLLIPLEHIGETQKANVFKLRKEHKEKW